MSSESFDRELRHVQDRLLDLGAMVESAISQSVEALKTGMWTRRVS